MDFPGIIQSLNSGNMYTFCSFCGTTSRIKYALLHNSNANGCSISTQNTQFVITLHNHCAGYALWCRSQKFNHIIPINWKFHFNYYFDQVSSSGSNFKSSIIFYNNYWYVASLLLLKYTCQYFMTKCLGAPICFMSCVQLQQDTWNL